MLALAVDYQGKIAVPSPAVTDLMLEMLSLTPQDKLLEIGTGSGYQTERFAETGAEIHTIELEPWIDPTVPMGDCIFLYHGDGAKGVSSAAPFTAIVATCGVEEIPVAWPTQLSDGGRLVAPIGNAVNQRLTLFRKIGTELEPERIGAYVRFQMLREPAKPRKPRYDPYGHAH